MRWSQVLTEAIEISRIMLPPVILVFHARENDLCNMRLLELLMLIRADLDRIGGYFQEMVLIWSEIIPRVTWQASRNAALIERACRTLNTRMLRFLRFRAGVVIPTPPAGGRQQEIDALRWRSYWTRYILFRPAGRRRASTLLVGRGSVRRVRSPRALSWREATCLPENMAAGMPLLISEPAVSGEERVKKMSMGLEREGIVAKSQLVVDTGGEPFGRREAMCLPENMAAGMPLLISEPAVIYFLLTSTFKNKS